MNDEGIEFASVGTGDGKRKAFRKPNASKRSVRTPDNKRTAIYARSRDEEGIARQVETGRAYAFRVLGVDPGAVVVLTDNGGAMDPDRYHRPGVGELISRIEEFSRIVVADIDRLSRDQTATAKFGRLLAGTGCELHATTSGRVAADAMSISKILTMGMARPRKRAPRIAAKPR